MLASTETPVAVTTFCATPVTLSTKQSRPRAAHAGGKQQFSGGRGGWVAWGSTGAPVTCPARGTPAVPKRAPHNRPRPARSAPTHPGQRRCRRRCSRPAPWQRPGQSCSWWPAETRHPQRRILGRARTAGCTWPSREPPPQALRTGRPRWWRCCTQEGACSQVRKPGQGSQGGGET